MENENEHKPELPTPRIFIPTKEELARSEAGKIKLNLMTETEFSKSPNKYVIISKDGSTVMQGADGKPWYSTSRGYAEEMAKNMANEVGGVFKGCAAVPFKQAVESVLRHPKNQPPKKFKH